MDVLSRLGATAVGLTTTVKPLIAPMFLRAPRDTGDAAEAGFDAPVPSDDRALRPASQLDAPARHTHAQPRPLPQPPPPRAADGPAPVREDADAPAIDAPVRYRPIEPVDAVLVPLQTQTEHRQTFPSHETQSAGDSIRDLAPPAQVSAPVRPLERQRPLIPPPPREQPRATPTDDLDPLVPADVRPVGSPALLDRLRSLRDRAPAAPPPADPVVRVTIGRIEVRSAPAAAPEPAAPPARPAPPRLTLAEYLSRKREAR